MLNITGISKPLSYILNAIPAGFNAQWQDKLSNLNFDSWIQVRKRLEDWGMHVKADFAALTFFTSDFGYNYITGRSLSIKALDWDWG